MTAPTLPMPLPEQVNPNPPPAAPPLQNCRYCRTVLPTAPNPLDDTELAHGGCIDCLASLDA